MNQQALKNKRNTFWKESFQHIVLMFRSLFCRFLLQGFISGKTGLSAKQHCRGVNLRMPGENIQRMGFPKNEWISSDKPLYFFGGYKGRGTCFFLGGDVIFVKNCGGLLELIVDFTA